MSRSQTATSDVSGSLLISCRCASAICPQPTNATRRDDRSITVPAATSTVNRALTAVRSQALSQNHGLDGFQHDENVEPKGHVLDVEELVLELLKGILNGRTIWVLHLCPPRKPWLDHVPLPVVRNLFGELPH